MLRRASRLQVPRARTQSHSRATALQLDRASFRIDSPAESSRTRRLDPATRTPSTERSRPLTGPSRRLEWEYPSGSARGLRVSPAISDLPQKLMSLSERGCAMRHRRPRTLAPRMAPRMAVIHRCPRPVHIPPANAPVEVAAVIVHIGLTLLLGMGHHHNSLVPRVRRTGDDYDFLGSEHDLRVKQVLSYCYSTFVNLQRVCLYGHFIYRHKFSKGEVRLGTLYPQRGEKYNSDDKFIIYNVTYCKWLCI